MSNALYKQTNIDDLDENENETLKNDIEQDTDKEDTSSSSSSCCDGVECPNVSNKAMLWICCIIFIIGILLTVILIPVSINQVEHDEYAVRYDDFTNKVDPNIYTEGKYVLTPQTIMFKFSNLVKKMEVDIQCLTSNGIEVQIDVDVQYQLPQNQVYNAFTTFGEEPRCIEYLTLVIRDSVRDTCGAYEAKDYYEDRLLIQTQLELTLQDDVRYANAFYNITSAVLSAYDFPDQLEEAIRDKRAAENDITIAENERDGELVEANTVLLTAIVEAESMAIDAQAEVDSILAEANAKATSIAQTWHNRANVYEHIMDDMNFTDEQFVFQYLTSVVFLNAQEPITALG